MQQHAGKAFLHTHPMARKTGRSLLEDKCYPRLSLAGELKAPIAMICVNGF